MNVWGTRDGRRRTATISSSGASALRFGPTRKSVSASMRAPPALRSSTCAPATSSGGSASPAGEAVARLPPIVPRFRICGDPTVREAPGERRQFGGQLALHQFGVGDAGAEDELVALAPPRAQLVDARQVEHAGRPVEVEVQLDEHIGATRQRPAVGAGRAHLERIRERSGSEYVHVRVGRVVPSSGMTLSTDALRRRLAVARGDEPPDLVVRGGLVLSVFTREWLETDVAVVDGVVAGLGDYEGGNVLDATGRYVVPGFIDAHLHLESSKLLVDEFARLVLPFGTTTVVADPHEIANVLGTDGVHWLLDACVGPSARRVLHRQLVRPGLAFRIAAPAAHSG